MPDRVRPLANGTRSALLILLASAALAAPSVAQTVRNRVITENPNRTVGGSCIYGGDGKLIYAPHGANCPEKEQPPASIAPEAAPAQRTPPSVAAAPAQGLARAEFAALLAERESLDVELARIREAIAYEDREAARNMVEESLRRIGRHLEHEARVLQPLAKSAP